MRSTELSLPRPVDKNWAHSVPVSRRKTSDNPRSAPSGQPPVHRSSAALGSPIPSSTPSAAYVVASPLRTAVEPAATLTEPVCLFKGIR